MSWFKDLCFIICDVVYLVNVVFNLVYFVDFGINSLVFVVFILVYFL